MSEGADAKMTLSGGKTSCSSGLVKCANVTSGIKGDYVLNPTSHLVVIRKARTSGQPIFGRIFF